MGVQRVLLDGQRTWTVTGDDHLPAGPVEEYLEFLRVAQQASPNTVRSYATSLARWWQDLTTARWAVADGGGGGGDPGGLRPVGSRVWAVDRIGPGPAPVRRPGGDGHEAGRAVVDASLRLACRAGRHPVHRGGPAAGSSGRGAVQE